MIKSQLIIFTSKYAYPPGTLVICVWKVNILSQFPFFASHIQSMAESWSFCLFNISLSSPLPHPDMSQVIIILGFDDCILSTTFLFLVVI